MIGKLSAPQKVLYYGLLLFVAAGILFPIYYMLIVSLKLPRSAGV